MSVVQECPRCSRKLRVPNDKGKIKVTCKCRRSWIYDPNALMTDSKEKSVKKVTKPDKKDISSITKEIQIPFRCSQNGGHFSVLLEWNEERKLYEFIDAIKEGNDGGTGLTNSQDKVFEFNEKLKVETNNIDWDGFFCAHCLFDEGFNNFVQCGLCKEFVCGNSITIVDGDRYFQCYSACGHHGKIEGVIEDYKAEEHNEREQFEALESKKKNFKSVENGKHKRISNTHFGDEY